MTEFKAQSIDDGHQLGADMRVLLRDRIVTEAPVYVRPVKQNPGTAPNSQGYSP